MCRKSNWTHLKHIPSAWDPTQKGASQPSWQLPGEVLPGITSWPKWLKHSVFGIKQWLIIGQISVEAVENPLVLTWVFALFFARWWVEFWALATLRSGPNSRWTNSACKDLPWQICHKLQGFDVHFEPSLHESVVFHQHFENISSDDVHNIHLPIHFHSKAYPTWRFLSLWHRKVLSSAPEFSEIPWKPENLRLPGLPLQNLVQHSDVANKITQIIQHQWTHLENTLWLWLTYGIDGP